MAGKKRGNDIDFGDINLDSELDIPGWSDNGFDLKDNRSPISHFASTAKGTLGTRLTDRNMLRKLVGVAAPKGYSQLFNAYDGIRKGVSDIYRENQADVQPFLIKSGRMLERNSQRFFNLLPRGVKQMIKDSEKASGSSGGGEQSELSANLGAVEALFASRLKDEKITKVADDLIKKRQFELQMAGNEQQARLLNRLVSYQDTVLIQYHKKSLELGYRQFDVSARILATTTEFHRRSLEFLGAIGKNTALPDFVKMNTEEAVKDSLRRKLTDSLTGGISGWSGSFATNLKAKVSQTIGGVVGGLSAASSMGSSVGLSKSAMAGMSLGGMAGEMAADRVAPLLEYLVGLAAPTIEKVPGVQRTGNVLRKWLTAPAQQLNRWAKSTTEQEGVLGELIDTMKNFVDQYDPNSKIRGQGVESLQDPARFDKLFHTTVTEIIPAYMASMDKSLRELVTGIPQEENAFSHYTGGMVTRSTLNKQNIRVGIKQAQGDNIRREVDTLMSDMGATELTPQAKRALRVRLLKDLQSGNTFDPSDYVKLNAWPEVDESVGDELIEFFSDQFKLDLNGKFVGNQKDITFTQDVNQSFTDVSKRLPNVKQRMSALTDVLGRRSFRESGLTRFDGIDGDSINTDAFNRIMLGDGDDDVLDIGKTRKLSKIDLKDLKGSMARRNAEKKSMMEDMLLEALELERQNEQTGANEAIDSTSGILDSIMGVNRQATPSPQSTSKESAEKHTGKLERLNFKLRDQGTHQRLDKVIELMRDRSFSSDRVETSTASASVNGNPMIDKLVAKAGDLYKEGLEKGGRLKGKASQAYREAEAKVKAHPRVRKGLAYIESTYGKITDPELRASVINAIYERTGTPQEIGNKLRSKMRELKQSFDSQKDASIDWIKDKTSPANREKYKEEILDYLDTTRDKISGFAASSKQWAKDHTSKDSINGYRQQASDLAERFMAFASNKISSTRDRFSRDGDMGDVMSTHDAIVSAQMARLIEINEMQGSLLNALVAAQQGEPVTEETLSKGKQWFGTIGAGAGKAFGKMAGGIYTAAKWYGSKVLSVYKGAFGLGTRAVGGAASAAMSLSKKAFVTDIYVTGSDTPVMTAKEIRSGLFKDVNTDDVITAIKDITGPVMNIRTGEIVLTADDFAKGLYTIKGESLLSKLGKAAGVAGSLAKGYVGNTYGLMFKGVKAVADVIIDQFTQFDAYFPGEDTPRIRSVLLKKSYYRDGKGDVITSLKDITGPVYDPDGNEIISQSDIDKYKSLYSRNGSLLFTFGRGMITAGKFAATQAIRLGKAYFTMALKAYKFVGQKAYGAMKWLGSKLTGGKFGGDRSSGGLSASLEELQRAAFDVSLKQLDTQQQILKFLKGDPGDVHDLDGDGVRENSWLDRQRKKLAGGGAAAAGAATNADVVNAIDQLGDRMQDNLETLGGQVEESGGGGDTNIGVMGGIKDFFGGRRKGRLGRLGGALGRGGKWVGRGLLATAGFGLKRLAIPAVMMAGKGLMMGATALVGAVGAPVLLGIAAVAGLSYLGYRAYQNAKIKDKPMYFLRMTQYGVSTSDGARVDQILALEALVRPGITGLDNNGLPQLDPNRFDVAKVESLFGIPPSSQSADDDEEMANRRKNLYAWIAYRFKPVYLAHCKAASKAYGSVDLSVMDDRIKGKQLESALSYTLLPGLEQMYDKTEISPFDGDLSEDKGDVNSIADKVRDIIRNAPKEMDRSKELTVDGKALTESAKAAVTLEVNSKGEKDVEKLKEDLTRNAQASQATRRGQSGKFANQAVSRGGSRSLSISNAVRYHSYGVTELRLDKVEDLHKIESLFWDKLEFDATKSVVLTGDMKEHVTAVQTILRASTQDHKAQVDLWFTHRFLPAFYQYALGIRRNFNGPIKDGDEKISGETLKAVLRSVSEVTTRLDGASRDIWSVPFSPWINYVLADDPSIIAKYLKAIPSSEPGPLKVEGMDRINDQGTDRDGDYKKFLMGRATASKLDGQGKQTDTGSIINNMRAQYATGGGNRSGAGLLLAGSNAKNMGVRVPHPGGGSGGDINSLPESTGKGAAANRALITAAAQMVGFDPTIAMTVAGIESTWNPEAGAGSSSAKGLFQFIDTTWAAMIQKYGAKYGINPNASPMDPKANAIMGALYLRDNYNTIKRNNPDAEVTDHALYMAHFLGPGGAGKWLRQNPNTMASQGTWDIGQFNANPGVFRDKSGRELTVGETNAKIEERLKSIRRAAGSGSASAVPAPSGSDDVGIDTPASNVAPNPEMGTETTGIMAPAAKPTSPTLPIPPSGMPSPGPAPAFPSPPSTTANLIAQRNQIREEKSAGQMNDLGTILTQQLDSLRNIELNTQLIAKAIEKNGVPTRDDQVAPTSSNQQPGQQGNVQRPPQGGSSVKPMSRPTTSNSRAGAI